MSQVYCKVFLAGKLCPYLKNCKLLHQFPPDFVQNSGKTTSTVTMNPNAAVFQPSQTTNRSNNNEPSQEMTDTMEENENDYQENYPESTDEKWFDDLEPSDPTLELEFDEILFRAQKYPELIQQIEDMKENTDILNEQLQDLTTQIKELGDNIQAKDKQISELQEKLQSLNVINDQKTGENTKEEAKTKEEENTKEEEEKN